MSVVKIVNACEQNSQWLDPQTPVRAALRRPRVVPIQVASLERPPRESWRTLNYGNLTASFASEILGEVDGTEGNFDDGLWLKEVASAMEISDRARRWASLPLEPDHADETGR